MARVVVSGRNGYQGIDLADDQGGIQKTLMVGTKAEAWEYIHAMMEALWLLDEPYGPGRGTR